MGEDGRRGERQCGLLLFCAHGPLRAKAKANIKKSKAKKSAKGRGRKKAITLPLSLRLSCLFGKNEKRRGFRGGCGRQETPQKIAPQALPLSLAQ